MAEQPTARAQGWARVEGGTRATAKKACASALRAARERRLQEMNDSAGCLEVSKSTPKETVISRRLARPRPGDQARSRREARRRRRAAEILADNKPAHLSSREHINVRRPTRDHYRRVLREFLQTGVFDESILVNDARLWGALARVRRAQWRAQSLWPFSLDDEMFAWRLSALPPDPACPRSHWRPPRPELEVRAEARGEDRRQRGLGERRAEPRAGLGLAEVLAVGLAEQQGEDVLVARGAARGDDLLAHLRLGG